MYDNVPFNDAYACTIFKQIVSRKNEFIEHPFNLWKGGGDLVWL